MSKEKALTAPEREVLEAANDPILQQMLAEERVEATSMDSALLWRILGYLRPHAWLAAAAVGAATVEAMLLTLPPWVVGLAVDRLQGAPEPTGVGGWLTGLATSLGAMLPVQNPASALFVAFGLLVAGLWSLRWGLGAASMFGVQLLGQRVIHDLRVDVYRHIMSMDLGYFHANPVGRLVNRATFDVQSLAELFTDAVAEGMRDVLFVLVLMAVMVSLDAPLGLLLIGAFPILAICAELYRRLGRPALRSMSAVQSRMNGWMAENLAGMRDNQLYRRRARRRAEFRALTEAHQAAVTRVIQAWGFVRPGMMITSGVATTLVLWIGSGRVEAGTLTLGILLTFLQYTSKLWVPVRNLTEKFNLIQTSLTSAERIADVLDATTKMKSAPNADSALHVQRGEVRFENVSFRYEGTSRDVLHSISFSAAPGTTLALVGDTGAGKSTVAHLLSRFYDTTEGRVLVDGHDVREYQLQKLRAGIALVPQDVVIFAGTLRENITLGAEVPDERLTECLKAVCAGELLSQLPGGLDHELEESGRTLSQGQRQLLAFARALVANPPVLLLDEATANVDTQTEAKIQLALQELTKGRTSIVIAHRLSTIRDADQILVLRHGEVIERGNHASLLSQDGEYARLYRTHLRSQTGLAGD